MSYTPPPSNAIILALTSGYTPPSGDTIPLPLGDTAPRLTITGASSVLFSSAGTYDTAFSVAGMSNFTAVLRDQDTAFLFQGVTAINFVNPDRAPVLSGVSTAGFSSEIVAEGGYAADCISTVDFWPKVEWLVAGTSSMQMVGERIQAYTFAMQGASSGAFSGRQVKLSGLSIVAGANAAFIGRAKVSSPFSAGGISAFSSEASPVATGRVLAKAGADCEWIASPVGTSALAILGGSSVLFSEYSMTVDTVPLPDDGADTLFVVRRANEIFTTRTQQEIHVQ